jgi:hypothetical protein
LSAASTAVRPNVAHDLRALERLGQLVNVVLALDDFVGGRFQPHHTLLHHFQSAPGITRHGGKGNVLVDQPVHGEHAGIAARTIDNHAMLCHLVSNGDCSESYAREMGCANLAISCHKFVI